VTTDSGDRGALDEVERELLGGPRRYTRFEVAERAGVPLELSVTLWRALGFADVDDDYKAFTDRDIEALRSVQTLVERGVIDEHTRLGMTRSMGQTLSRLAEWQVAALTSALAKVPNARPEDAVVAARELMPVMEGLIGYVWRRHLAALAGRALGSGSDELVARHVVVGFADLVGFTSLTRQVSEEELGHLVDRFEATATDIVASRSGRIVKTVGDEVMFTADDAGTGADIATRLADEVSAIDELPDLRIGMAYGPVLARLGDLYGEPVNIASRLTSIARPGSVLVDREMGAALEGDGRWGLRRVPPRPVRGYTLLHALRLRRAEDPAGGDGGSQSDEPG
jgi:adenylate cyclase